MPSTLRELLLRPIYTGTYEAYRRRSKRQTVEARPGVGAGRKQRLGNPDELLSFSGIAPALVTPAEHEAIRGILVRNATHSTRNNANPEATLLRAGVAICGHCGRALGVANPTARGGNRSAVYRCNARAKGLADCPQPCIAASVIDDAVWERVCTVLRNPELIAAEVARHRANGGLDGDLAAIDRHLVPSPTSRPRRPRYHRRGR